MKRFILVLKLSVLVCAGKLLLIHPCGISVCYLKSRQAFARGLTGEEEEEEISEEEGVASSGSDVSVDSDLIVYGMNIDATWLNSSTSSTLPRVNVMLHQALQGKLRLVDVNLPLLQMNHQSLTACIKYIFER